MEIIEEAARIGGFHDDLTVSRVAFEAAAGFDMSLRSPSQFLTTRRSWTGRWLQVRQEMRARFACCSAVVAEFAAAVKV